MCSKKCDMPPSSIDSFCPPIFRNIPIDAEDDDGNIHKLSNPEITMEPYVPLAKEQKIIVRYDEIISAYETHDDVVAKYNQLVGATNGIESESPVDDKQE